MQVREVRYENAQPIDAYGPGFFRIAGEVIHGPMLVTAEAVRGWDGLDDIDALVALAGQVDVLFLGTGAEMTQLPDTALTALRVAGIAVEAMSSPAACRSYNVLLGEGRRVALAALAV